jgi:hypothetical protein
MSVEEIKANGKKGKAILYRPKKAPSAAGDWGSQDYHTVGSQKWQCCQPKAPAAFARR